MACQSCRSRKIKCDRTRPVCQNCRARSTECTYAGERRKRRWIRASGVDARRFSVIKADGQARRPSITRYDVAGGTSRSPRAGEAEGEGRRRESAASTQTRMADLQCQDDFDDDGDDSDGDESLLDRILDGSEEGAADARSPPALWMRASDGDEYTGPSSGISTISDIGLRWVRENVADSGVLCDTIQDIRNGVLDHLRRPKCIPRDMPLPPAWASPDAQGHGQSQGHAYTYPDDQMVRTYVDAYFDNVQIIFPILDRGRFLAQLNALGTTSPSPSWQALLSAVLASGCRSSLSAETAEAFRSSGREAWCHFLHALSFETRILHGSTDLMAVQAVAVMTVFAQGLSSPQRLEYTLSSIAVRLAQSIALDRPSALDWHLAEDERRERDRVFWSIYCLDRLVALRCGRPAVIADRDVSCGFPRAVIVNQGVSPGSGGEPSPPSVNTTPVDFFLCLARLARICGTISRRLYSATALHSPATALLPVFNRLLEDLHAWLGLLPPIVRPGRPPNRMASTCGLLRDQVIVLHLSYYYVLCAIYRRFTPLFTPEAAAIRHLLDNKMHPSHVESARAMVLLTKHLDIESFTPAWLVFYYPFTALTTLFVHVVSEPLNEGAQSDIALMETVVGFFGRLEYVTSGEAAFTKTTEFVRHARSVTARHASTACAPIPSVQQPPMMTQGNEDDDPCRMLGLTPPLSEALREDKDQSQDGLGPHGGMMGVQQDGTMYVDLSGLMTTPTGGSINVNWMDDLISAV